MVEAQALSVETVDSKVLNLAREDIVWHSVSELITDVPDKEMLGLNIVEFAGDAELIESQVTTLCQRLDELIAQGEGGVIGWQLCNDLAGIERIYAMRKKAARQCRGRRSPFPLPKIPAPPEHLADYIVEFRALLDSHGLSYGMFGHDAGVLHVRPALDMCDPQQEILMKQISDDVVALTAKYGGLRARKRVPRGIQPGILRRTALRELRKVKAAFDPHNRLNPGKICPPEGVDAPMLQVDAVKRGTYDRQSRLRCAPPRGAMECNGNGLCFNFDVKSPMCPSMKITSNRIHSPKGRATLVREWLRLLADRVDPLKLEQELPEKGPACAR
jgi:hypothetical protein